MRKKFIIILLIILGIGAVAFAYWTISPLFINVRVSEEMPVVGEKPTEPAPAILLSGEFRGLEGHNASGTAKLLKVGDKTYIRFEEDFKVTNGPDLFVYLGKNGQYDASANLGSLRGNIGSQNYEIPSEVDLSKYDSVWVWCRAFRVAFGVADFK